MSNTPVVGQSVSVSFRTDGNCKRVKAAEVSLPITAVYTDKDKYGNPKVKLSNGDVFFIQNTSKGWVAVL